MSCDAVGAGNIQWFYFSVNGGLPGQTVRFNLVNHNKEDSLFNYGLLPAVYSDVDASTRAYGWRRIGTNACYYRSASGFERRKKSAKSGKASTSFKHFYITTFTYTFTNLADTVYFAYCQPYTASNLQRFLLVRCRCLLLLGRPARNW